MKTTHINYRLYNWLEALSLCFVTAIAAVSAQAQTTAFTYQGRLNDGGNPASGTYDLNFALFDAAAGGGQQGGTVTQSAVGVSNGLFTVALDFGAGVFTGAGRWLEIEVRTNGGGAFLTLAPRQGLTSTPYALRSAQAGLAATVAAGAVNTVALQDETVTGAKIQNGTVGVEDLDLDSLNTAIWRTGGNLGTTAGTHFLGTTDSQPIEFKVNGQRVLRVDAAWNLVAGHPSNSATMQFATVAGGGDATQPNTASFYGSVGGGAGNTAAGGYSVVAGGSGNHAAGLSFIGGGQMNSNGANWSVITGGRHNTNEGACSVIAGGQYNRVSGNEATIGGGSRNTSIAGVVAGGQDNLANRGTVGGGSFNIVDNATVSGGYSNIGSNGAAIGGGALNNAWGSGTVVAGGSANRAEGYHAVVSGGHQNSSVGILTVTAGGLFNTNGGYASVIGGGVSNTNTGSHATVGGGYLNRSSGAVAVIAGGYSNTNGSHSGVIGGGYQNTNTGDFATISGGKDNTASGQFATVPGGEEAVAAGRYSLAAGRRSGALHDGSFVWADDQEAAFVSTGPRQLLLRAQGGVGIGTNNPQSALHVAGTVSATGFSGDGSGLTGIQASDAGSLTNGTLPSSALGGTYGRVLSFTNGANAFTGSHTGNGAGLTNLNASALALGTLADARLSTNVALLIANQTFDGVNSFVHPSNSFLGAHAGDGSGLTSLNAGNLASGLVPDARLSPSLARTSQVWLLGGNSGTLAGTHFVGTADGQPLEFKVNGQRVLRLEPHGTSPNLLGGYSGNFIAEGLFGSTIGGGGRLNSSNSVLASGVTVAGGMGHKVGTDSSYSAIGGGYDNSIANSSASATIAGGTGNHVDVSASSSVIGGGAGNNISNNSLAATIAGGNNNDIRTASLYATIGGGLDNNIAAGVRGGTVAGGEGNDIGFSSRGAAIGGGLDNNIADNANYATIPGGTANFATNHAFAAGTRAKAAHTGSFVWSDSTAGDFSSTASNQFNIRASGGMGVGTTSPGAQLDVSSSGSDGFPQARLNQTSIGDYSRLRFTVGGDYSKRWDLACRSNTFVLYSGQLDANMLQLDSAGLTVRGTFVSSSDRNVKENFQPVDTQAVLDKVVALPLTEWNYKQDTTTRHLGPMAQDFHAAFAIGPDDKHIATVDADGVALAAIQGLNQKLERENAKLKLELAEIKRLVEAMSLKLNGGTK